MGLTGSELLDEFKREMRIRGCLSAITLSRVIEGRVNYRRWTVEDTKGGLITLTGEYILKTRVSTMKYKLDHPEVINAEIDKGLHKKADRYHPMRVTARARTLALLGQLDRERKRTVLLFLREARLINSKARCREGRLAAYPRLVGLEDADWKDAKLGKVRLISADRREAFSLERADLERADLVGADQERADLRKVVLKSVDLSGANLSGADLRGADLRGADLTNATVTDEQLATCKCLEGATMPDGQMLKSDANPGRRTFEEWLKSKRREEDG